VAKGYCDNTNIMWQKDYFNKSEIGGAKPLSQRQNICGERILQQCKYFMAKRLFQQSRFRGGKEFSQRTIFCGERLLRQ
jgi:hypothetical protein